MSQMPPPNPAPIKLIIEPYALQKSLICSWVVKGSITFIVIFATLRIFPLAGIEKLKLPKLRNLDGKREPVDIFANTGTVYFPTRVSFETLTLKTSGTLFVSDALLLDLVGLLSLFTLIVE